MFIGDGAGIGKGRQIAGVILDNFARGRRRSVRPSFSCMAAPACLRVMPVDPCSRVSQFSEAEIASAWGKMSCQFQLDYSEGPWQGDQAAW